MPVASCPLSGDNQKCPRHCQMSPEGRTHSGGTLCSEASEETTCAFTAGASPRLSCVGLKLNPSVLGFPSVSGLALFPEIFSPPYPSGQRRTRATPVQGWFYKAARCWEMSGPLRQGKQKFKAPKVMSLRPCPDSDRSLSSILLCADGAHRRGETCLGTGLCSAQPEARRSACTALSPSDHCSSLGASGKQEPGTA